MGVLFRAEDRGKTRAPYDAQPMPAIDNTAQARWLALAAVVLWATLATLGTALAHVPPFLLTGMALLAGSLIALPLARFDLRRLRVPWRTLAIGVYGLFGYHFLLFSALGLAPAVQANLVNYLWPLLIVLLAPALLPGVRASAVHLAAALTGFAGAVVAILGRAATNEAAHAHAALGYVCAAGAALVWASYSLLTKRLALTGRDFPTAAVGGFGLVSGVLALACHALLEPPVALDARDGVLIAALGLGPLGGAFYLWDRALKLGDARQIGVLSYLTPLLSTVLLLWTTGQPLSWSVALATVLILAAAMLGARAR